MQQIGLAELSQNLHRCIRNNLCQGTYKEKVRPILINSWEASYFDFDGRRYLQILQKQAKGSGNRDVVVLDDGWFGNRE
ncbi:MAG: alpha-galactosidase [Coprococcus sp.]